MAKRELSYRKKKKGNKKNNKNNSKYQNNQNRNEKDDFVSANNYQNRNNNNKNDNNNNNNNNNNFEMPKNLPYESFILKLKGNKKYPKSLEYLSVFVNSKSEWKFNKNLQTFLFKYVLLKDAFDKKYFDMFKKYFRDMNENVKKKLVGNCIQCVEDHNKGKLKLDCLENARFSDKEDEAKVKAVFHKRCVELIEL